MTNETVSTESKTLPAPEVKWLSAQFDKMSIAYSKYGVKIPKEMAVKYANMAASPEMMSSKHPFDREWLVDYLRILAKIENEKAAIREGNGIEEISRELINLPKLAVETIKLSELVLKPDTFDGTKPKPRKWIQNYNEAIIANGWSDKIAVKYLPTFLSLSAKDWYFTEVKPHVNSNTQWYQIYGKFVDNYLSQSDHDQLTEAVENAKQRVGETVSNFIPRIRRLLLLLTPGLPEEDQLRQLKNKLRPEYKPLLAFSNPKSIAEFRSSCMKIEAGLPKARAKTEDNETIRKRPVYSTRKRITATTTVDRNRNRSKQTDIKSGTNTRKEIVCYNCNKPGHYSRDCKLKRSQKNSKYPQQKQVNLVQEEENEEEGETQSEEEESEASALSEDESQESVRVITVKQSPENLSKPRYIVTEEQLNLVVGGGKLLRQKVICNDAEINAVVDTGAYVSVIDSALVNHFKWKTTGPAKALVGADGASLCSKGMVDLKIEIIINSIRKTKQHSVAVVENLTAPMLLGLELMREFRVHIDVPNLKLSFAKDNIAGGIKSLQNEIIPPRCQMVLEGRVNMIGSVMAVPFMLENGLIIANSIDSVTSNVTRVVALNPSNRKIQLPAGTQLASAENLTGSEEPSRLPNANSVDKITEVKAFKEKIKVGDELSEQQIGQLTCVLNECSKAFSINGEIGKTNVHEHEIELLANSEPIAEPLRRRAQIQIEETRRQVKELLKEGIIEESSSPWASAYVLAKKKNGEFRLCIDFRKLNSVTKKVVYPLPNIEACLETLSGKLFFTQLDFKSGFWQIAIERKAKELTAFRTEDGLFQFKRMPFGLTNAPASFQKMINTVLAGLLCDYKSQFNL